MIASAATERSPRGGQPRLSARGVSVTLSGNTVLRSADLQVSAGEIVGLLGANGSGKSTMVKVLTGVYQSDEGAQLEVNGKAVSLDGYGPLRAHELGVRVVHQEAPIIPNMTIADMVGLQLGFPVAGPWIRQRELEERAGAVLEDSDVRIDPRRSALSMTAAERAMVSLAIVLGDVRPADATLILDEASASLSTTDAARFLERVRDRAREGLAVLMVTHRLPEVHEYCARAVVLRDGAVVDEQRASEFDDRELVRAMSGPAADPPARVAAASSRITSNHAASERNGSNGQVEGQALLTVENLAGEGVAGIDLEIAPGEIVGVTGRSDGGAAQLLRLIAGIEPRHRGTIRTRDGATVAGGPRGSLDAGIVYLSSDRLSEGGVMGMSVFENLVLPRVERFGVFGRGKAAVVAQTMELLDVRPRDPHVRFGSLSGGNQQKVLLGRWLSLEPTLLVLDDPTAGVDPATRERIFALVADLASSGVAVLLRSTEPEQLARLCSRVLVVRDGGLVGTLTGDFVNPEEISLATYS